MYDDAGRAKTKQRDHYLGFYWRIQKRGDTQRIFEVDRLVTGYWLLV
jgi:hypothetical protein